METDVRSLPLLRRFGAESSPMRCVCGRVDTSQDPPEAQRFIPIKCLSCAITLMSGKPSMSENERLREKALRIEREQVELVRLTEEARVQAEIRKQQTLEEERRSYEILQERKKALAKQKRVEYSRMFRPQITAIDHLSPDQRDSLLLEPVPAQLESLLPIALGSKNEFQHALKQYRKSRNQLKRIRKEEIEKRRAAVAEQESLKAGMELAERHARLIKLSLERLGFRQLSTCFRTWRVWSKMRKSLAAHLHQKRLQRLKFCFRQWKHYRRETLRKKTVCAVVLQASTRKYCAKGYVRKLIRHNKAANVINSFARACLAKNILKLAKQRMKRNEERVRSCLQKLMKNNKQLVFYEWKTFVAKMKSMRRFLAKGNLGILANHFLVWQRYTSMRKRVKKREAAEFLSRVGKGFIARLYAARARIRNRAALKIQSMYRASKARTVLKLKLRQHRLLKKKVRRGISGKKRECFCRWVEFIKCRRTLLLLMGKSDKARLKQCFKKWCMRKEGALKIQRVFRGAISRKKAKKLRLKAMRAYKPGKTRLASNVLFDESVSSPYLESLRKEYTRVKTSSFVESAYTLNLHGAPQQFDIKKHKDLVLTILAKEIEKEICRLQEAEHLLQETIREENEVWERTLEDFLVTPDFSRLDRFRAYKNVGKSFKFKAVTKEFTIETLNAWKHMYDLEYITKWTFVGWLAEAFLLRRGVRAVERNGTWDLIQEKLDPSFVEDLATYTLHKIRKPRQFLKMNGAN